MAEELLILVDCSSYLYRAFHALPALSSSKGEVISAIQGVIAMFRRLIKDYQATYFAVVFDAKGKTFRDALYPQYKVNRPLMPEDLGTQIEPLHAIIQAMGLPLIIIDRVEADDVVQEISHSANVIAVFQQMGGERMTQAMTTRRFLDTTLTHRPFYRFLDGIDVHMMASF
jgi:DNA polymerase-1